MKQKDVAKTFFDMLTNAKYAPEAVGYGKPGFLPNMVEFVAIYPHKKSHPPIFWNTVKIISKRFPGVSFSFASSTSKPPHIQGSGFKLYTPEGKEDSKLTEKVTSDEVTAKVKRIIHKGAIYKEVPFHAAS